MPLNALYSRVLNKREILIWESDFSLQSVNPGVLLNGGGGEEVIRYLR